MRATFVPIKEEYEKFCRLPKQDLHEFNWPLQGTVNLGVASVVKTVTVSREHRGHTGWLRAAGQWGWRTTGCSLESQCIRDLLMDTQPSLSSEAARGSGGQAGILDFFFVWCTVWSVSQECLSRVGASSLSSAASLGPFPPLSKDGAG